MRFDTRIRPAAALLAMLWSAPAAMADMPVTYKDGGRSLFSFNVPDFWSVRVGGARQLSAPGDDDTRDIARVIGLNPETDPAVWVGFMSPHGVGDFQDALAYLAKVGPFLVKDPKVETRKKRQIGGLPGASIAGTGRRKGRAVDFTAVLVDLPNGRMAISVAVFEAGADPEIVEDVNAIYGSFRAVR